MKKGHYWTADHMQEVGTEMDERTMNRVMKGAWYETENEHRAYVTKRIKRSDQKLVSLVAHQWIRQDHQTPITTMKNRR